MKKTITRLSLLGGFALLIAGALFLGSCEGPAGADGANGGDGTNGVDGVDGIAGIDGIDGVDNSSCIVCHSEDQTIVTKSRQYANSGHGMGHVSGYTNRSFGPAYNCASCHTSQGYLDNLVGASNTPYADVTQPNCYTCHNIHDSYTEDDWGLTHPDYTDPLTGSVGVDLGTGNQCTECHQMVGQYLAIDSLWANFDDGGLTTVTLTAGQSRAGVHHAPQYNILVGMDLFEFTGTIDYPTDNHVQAKAVDGCVTCHMNDGFGDLTGHSMAMTYEFHGSDNFHWSSSCTSCHDGTTADELDDKVEEIAASTDALMAQLYDLLITADIMYPSDDITGNAYLLKSGVFSTDLTAAHANYNAIREDKSSGFHNPGYVEAVLENTVEALSPS